MSSSTLPVFSSTPTLMLFVQRFNHDVLAISSLASSRRKRWRISRMSLLLGTGVSVRWERARLARFWSPEAGVEVSGLGGDVVVPRRVMRCMVLVLICHQRATSA